MGKAVMGVIPRGGAGLVPCEFNGEKEGFTVLAARCGILRENEKSQGFGVESPGQCGDAYAAGLGEAGECGSSTPQVLG